MTHTLGAPFSHARLGAMLSGSGRTLLNLLEKIRKGRLHANIELVIASRECLGAQRARDAGIATLVVNGEIPAPELEAMLTGHRIDLVACCGYLRRLHVPASFAGRIVNIHPALLPSFGGQGMYGDHVHEAVVEAAKRGEITESGCTVHLVDDQYDHGAVLLQMRCPARPEDDAHTLAARVFELECQAYPQALQQIIERGEWKRA